MIQRLLPESLSADKNKKAITKDGFLILYISVIL